jgi:lactoylglutathione lyase
LKIEHVAIWTNKLETLRAFYERYFGAKSSSRYRNEKKNFESYFLTFESGSRLELMSMPGIIEKNGESLAQFSGLAHFAISVGSKAQVDLMTEQFRKDGLAIIGEPRITGDGYYESVVLDPDGNRIEITI